MNQIRLATGTLVMVSLLIVAKAANAPGAGGEEEKAKRETEAQPRPVSREQDYIESLGEETFEDGAYRTCNLSKLHMSIGNAPYLLGYEGTPMVFARTPRFRKLIFRINEAKRSGKSDGVLGGSERAVRRLISDRQKVEQAILDLAKTKPEIFGPIATENQRDLLIDLVRFHWPHDILKDFPPNLEGTHFGLLANSILLGLAEDSHAVRPLLEIAQYDGKAFLDNLPIAFRAELRSTGHYDHYSVAAPHWVVADALDRILVACSRQDAMKPTARAVAEEYVQWRHGRGFPDRRVYRVSAYDAPLISYPFNVKEADRDTPTLAFELPMPPAKGKTPGLRQEDITKIFEWADRLIRTFTS